MKVMEAGGGSNPIKLPVAATTASNEKIVVRILLQQTNLDMVRISTNPAGEHKLCWKAFIHLHSRKPKTAHMLAAKGMNSLFCALRASA